MDMTELLQQAQNAARAFSEAPTYDHTFLRCRLRKLLSAAADLETALLTAPGLVPNELELGLLRQKQLVAAIKSYRARNGTGLKETKELLELIRLD